MSVEAIDRSDATSPRYRLPLRVIVLLVLVIAVVALVASRQPSLSAEATSEDSIHLKLRAGWRSVGYNLCMADLQRATDHGWESVPTLGPNEACTAEMRSFPLTTASRRFDVPGGLASGEYRVAARVEVAGSRKVLRTQTFFAR